MIGIRSLVFLARTGRAFAIVASTQKKIRIDFDDAMRGIVITDSIADKPHWRRAADRLSAARLKSHNRTGRRPNKTR